MIVVVSHPGDVHATRVMRALTERGSEPLLLDVADFPHHATLAVDYADPTAPALRIRHPQAGVVDLAKARSVWWRRPQFPDLSAIADPDAHGFAHGEWHEALYGLYGLLEVPWMNPPRADDAASRKAVQLRAAARLGLRVPDTLLTSDPHEAAAFVERHGLGKVVYKIFSATLKVWRETRLVTAADLAELHSLTLAPVIFQEYVPAAADLRVTMVGPDVFTMVIEETGELDFRMGLSRARTRAGTLPPEVEAGLRALMDAFGLVYGAVDLRLTPEGEHVFLEVNPAGEFLFAEAGAGLPITDAVAGWLAAPA